MTAWSRKALSVQLFQGWSRATPVFDDESLLSCAGLVPVMVLAEPAGLSELIAEGVSIDSLESTRHGIVAPSAGGNGLTLALFADLLSPEEQTKQVGDVQRWDQLPHDPRADHRLGQAGSH